MLLQHNHLGERDLSSVMQEAGVSLERKDISTWSLGIPGLSDAVRYAYVSPKSGLTIHALQYKSCIPPRGAHYEVWQFDHDFDEKEAIAALGERSYFNRRLG